jgi:hypothetical protein
MKYLKRFESYDPSEIEEMIEYIRDIYSDLNGDFDIKIIPQNIQAKDFRHIDVSISKKSSIPYKIDDETGEEVDDWVNYKPSTFKISEIMDTILSSKSYIESIDGEISKVWIHSNLNTGLDMSIDDLLNRPSRIEKDKKAWENMEVKQIGIKYSI